MSASATCQRLSEALRSCEGERAHVPLAGALVELDVLELEDHVDLVARRVGVEAGLFDGHAGHLADVEQLPVVVGEDLAVHLLQEIVDARAADVERRAVAQPAGVRGAVGQPRVLGEHVDDVHAEAVDAAVQPPAHHPVDGLADLRVLPVEVGLAA